MLQEFLTKRFLSLQVVLLGAVLFCLQLFAEFTNSSAIAVCTLLVCESVLLLPSISRGENFLMARERAVSAVLRDPLLYILGVALLLFGIYAVNGGLKLVYLPDAEIWKMSEPVWSGLPSSVGPSSALSSLCAFVAAGVCALAMRNAQNAASQRLPVGLLAVFSGGIGIALVVREFLLGTWGTVPAVTCGAGELGVFFGIWSLAAAFFYFDSIQRKGEGAWEHSSMLMIGVGGNALAMLHYAGAVWAFGWLFVLLLSLIYGFLILLKRGSGREILRFICFLLVLCVVIYGMTSGFLPGNPISEKWNFVTSFDYAKVLERWNLLRDTRVSAAYSIWEGHLWWGVGSEGFAHYARVAVAPENLKQFATAPGIVYNDFVQLLAEYGLIGMLLFSSFVVVVVVPFAVRLRRALSSLGRGAGEVEFFDCSPFMFGVPVLIVWIAVQAWYGAPLQLAMTGFSIVMIVSAASGFAPAHRR